MDGVFEFAMYDEDVVEEWDYSTWSCVERVEDGGVVAVVRDEDMGYAILNMPKVIELVKAWQSNPNADALDTLVAISEIVV